MIMSKCKNCGQEIPEIEEQENTAMLQEFDWSELEAKAIMPRCRACLNNLMMASLSRKTEQVFLPACLSLALSGETVYLVLDKNEKIVCVSIESDFLDGEIAAKHKEVGDEILAIEKLT